MAAQGSVKDWFTFVGGLNTEGGYFVTPDNAWVSGSNVVPQLDGSVHRRNGLDLEKDFTVKDFFTSNLEDINKAITTAIWTPIQGTSFIVVQYGYYLLFFNNTSGTVSSTLHSDRVALRWYPLGTETTVVTGNITTFDDFVDGTKPCNYSEINGSLIVTSENTLPIRVYYENERIYSEEITIKIRDFDGFSIFTDDPSNERTEADWDTWYSDNYGLSDGAERALYNLKNQGWGTSQIATYKAAYSNLLPANTKAWIYGKNASDVFDATLLNKQDFGSGLAPKGRFVIDAFNQIRTEGSFTDTIKYNSRPTVSAAFAGRAWYAGVNESELQGKVYFSQVVDNNIKLGYCYQSNDPTSEILSDLVDNDGGVINIPDAGKIVFLAAAGKVLLVFGENGVFAISGIDGVFSATNYQVEKITNVGALSGTSIVPVENSHLYWSTEGIYTISPDASGFTFQASNISDEKIKTYYNNIPLVSKKYAEGVYNSSKREVYWIYNDQITLTEEEDRFKRNAILALNLTLSSWHTHEILADNAKHMQSIVTAKEISAATTVATVVNSSEDIVVDSSGNEVTSYYTYPEPSQKQFKIVSKYVSNLGNTSKFNAANFSDTTSASTFLTCQHSLSYLKFSDNGTQNAYRLALLTSTNQSNIHLDSKMHILGLSAYGGAYSFILERDVSVGSSLHPGWGTVAYCFTPDGLRMYAVQSNGSTYRWGYYTLPGTHAINNALVTFTVSSGPSSSSITHMSIDNGKLNVMYVTPYPPETIAKRNISIRTYEVPVDGYFSSVGTPLVKQHFEGITKDNVFSQFSFTPDGMNIIVSLNESNSNSTYDTVFLEKALIYPLKQKYVAASISELHSDDAHSVAPIVGYRHHIFMPNDVPTVYGGNTLVLEYKHPKTGVVNPTISEYTIKDEYKYDLIGPLDSTEHTNVDAFAFTDFTNVRDTTTKFKDWYSIDNVGNEKEAYVLTGYQLADVGPARMKSGMYITTFAKRTETVFDSGGDPVNPSSVLMQLRWDFTDDYNTGKWNNAVETYRHIRPFIADPGATYESGYPLVTTKNKIRGRGRALQFKFSTSEGKDMKLVGWTGTFVGNTNV